MKKIFFTALAVIFCAISFAADNWKTCFKNNEVEILYQYSDCHDEHNGIHQQKVLLKFINSSNEKKEITFGRDLTYNTDGNINSLTGDVKLFSIQLQPNETKEGLCSDTDKALFIFSKQLNFKSSELGKFELKNISVKTIQ